MSHPTPGASSPNDPKRNKSNQTPDAKEPLSKKEFLKTTGKNLFLITMEGDDRENLKRGILPMRAAMMIEKAERKSSAVQARRKNPKAKTKPS